MKQRKNQTAKRRRYLKRERERLGRFTERESFKRIIGDAWVEIQQTNWRFRL